MASSERGLAAADTSLLDASRGSSISDASTIAAPYQDSFEDDEEASQYVSDRPRRTWMERLLWAASGASANSKRRRREDDYLIQESEQLRDGLLKKPVRRQQRPSPPREVRRCRRSYVGGCFRRALVALPIVMLSLLGLLHLAEFVFSRTGLLWDTNDYDIEYLPNWGKAGHEGEGLAGYPTDATRDVIPIPCHSHNDYWRRVPVFDAIHWGCTGIEADVWLFDEELYVGHNTAALTKNRTFRSLYVNPLVDLLDQMNPHTSFANTTRHGVFDEDPTQTLVLLVDFKTNGRDTYSVVHQHLSALREKDYLTYWDGEQLHRRAITVVGTGNAPFDRIMQAATHRDIFFDAPLDRLGDQQHSSSDQTPDANTAQASAQGTVGTHDASPDAYDASTSYYASVSFTQSVGFVWRGRLSARQLATIRAQIRSAHRRGLKARYWATPSWPVALRNHVWRVLVDEGADMLNVDDLRGAAVENWRARNARLW